MAGGAGELRRQFRFASRKPLISALVFHEVPKTEKSHVLCLNIECRQGAQRYFHEHREHGREEDSGEDAGYEHSCSEHAGCRRIFGICLRAGRVHHGERAQVAGTVAHDDGDAPVDVVIVDVHRKNALDSHRLIVAKQKQRNKNSSQHHRPHEESRRRPFHPRRSQTAQHRENVECQEASDVSEHFRRNNSHEVRLIGLHDVGVHCRKHGERHEEDEEHVKELHRRLLEDSPIRRARVDVDA